MLNLRRTDKSDLTHITNFERGIRFIYARAITTYRKQTKKDILEIRENAYWNNGCLDKKMNSLHFKQDAEPQDLSDFWVIYNKIERKEWRAYTRVCVF